MLDIPYLFISRERAIKPPSHYAWHRYTSEKPRTITHANGRITITLQKGDRFGVRRAKTDPNKIRMIHHKTGQNVVFSLSKNKATRILKDAKPITINTHANEIHNKIKTILSDTNVWTKIGKKTNNIYIGSSVADNSIKKAKKLLTTAGYKFIEQRGGSLLIKADTQVYQTGAPEDESTVDTPYNPIIRNNVGDVGIGDGSQWPTFNATCRNCGTTNEIKIHDPMAQEEFLAKRTSIVNKYTCPNCTDNNSPITDDEAMTGTTVVASGKGSHTSASGEAEKHEAKFNEHTRQYRRLQRKIAKTSDETKKQELAQKAEAHIKAAVHHEARMRFHQHIMNRGKKPKANVLAATYESMFGPFKNIEDAQEALLLHPDDFAAKGDKNLPFGINQSVGPIDTDPDDENLPGMV